MENLFKKWDCQKDFRWDEKTDTFPNMPAVMVAIKKEGVFYGSGSNCEMVEIKNAPKDLFGIQVFQTEYIKTENKAGYVCNFVCVCADFSDEELSNESNFSWKTKNYPTRFEVKRISKNLVACVCPSGNTIEWIVYAKGDFGKRNRANVISSIFITPKMYDYLLSYK
jgi:hypothetical protein